MRAATTSANDLARLVPGFDFLQGLMSSGGAALPGIGSWIAPTLDPAELQKRIDELRTVQFWLEQNSRLLGTTIQALEVQRMTVATLRGMNVPLADLTDALKVGSPAKAAAGPAQAAAPRKDAADAPGAAGKRVAAKAAGSSTTPAIDPMQWWGALTQQFTDLAAKALKDGSAEVARNLGGAAVTGGLAGGGSSIERMMAMASPAASPAAGAATKKGAGAAAAPAGRPGAGRRANKAA